MAEICSNVREIFCKALELESPEEVARYLDEVCRNDANLRKEVLTLLGAHWDAGNFLGDAPPEGDTIAGPPIGEGPGTVIGPYKLLEQIGEGRLRDFCPRRRILSIVGEPR